LIAYYQVIDQFNVKVLTCRNQLLGYSDVFWRRGGIAAGMIMTNDDCGTVSYNGGSIDFSGA
jgi:monoamine oxidase